MKLKRGTSRLWAFLFRARIVRARMPFWRVVVEARVDRRAGRWPEDVHAVVAPLYVWARTIEEAEALAALAIEDEGLEALTADAVKHPPAAAPRGNPAAVARGEWGFIARDARDAPAEDPFRRDARA
ncbi:MAG: hypothetical protein NVV62_06510 [Terricaulis sp.]|nr:hypothetical protein [Terricaulis sp.]